jgi:adenylosuccinate synthase
MKKAVIGLMYGDEGKGITTDYVASQTPNPIVVRFSGGHQAGHMVHHNGVRHVFSNFGSATLRGIPTYWSKYCTVDPTAVLNEYDVLKENGINPTLYIDPECPVTTPFDKHYNQNAESTLAHGTCGVGFGATIEREENHRHLIFQDLFNPTVLAIKLKMIKEYYHNVDLSKKLIDSFIIDCRDMLNIVKCKTYSITTGYNVIYEGSQGLLLDKDIGFFPHVTRSNTDDTNIKKIDGLMNYTFDHEFYLVTRAYQTRHGNGPMTNEDLGDNGIEVNPTDTNKDHPYQGKFRRTILDLDLLKYAYNNIISIRACTHHLVITCLDHVEGNWALTENGVTEWFSNEDDFVERIHRALPDCKKVIRVRSDKTKNIKE